MIKIEGQGLPQRGVSRSSRGNLYVKFTVVLPKNGSLNPAAIKTIRKVLGEDNVKYDMPNKAVNDTREIATGSKVKLVGLTNRPDLNGTDGTVIEANIRPGAHAVALSTGQTVSVRQELLELTDEMEEVDDAASPGVDDVVVDLVGDIVDMEKEKHTAAGIHREHEDDSDDDGGVSCRQM